MIEITPWLARKVMDRDNPTVCEEDDRDEPVINKDGYVDEHVNTMDTNGHIMDEPVVPRDGGVVTGTSLITQWGSI